MQRREFLKQVAAWSAGTALIEPVFSIPAALAAEVKPDGKPMLVVAKGSDYGALVEKAVQQLGGMASFVKKDQKVVIKPNIGWDRKPEQAANTHPDVVAKLVKLALDQGAKEVLVFDRSCNEARRCYASSGIQAAVEALKDPRAKCLFVDNRKFVPVKIENGKALETWDLYQDALDADVYINVPIAKHHGLSKLTLGLKNVMGVMGGRRGEIHKGIAQKLADLNTVVRPKLTVIDATRILLRHGPQGGNLEDVKQLDTIIASTDPVAADAYATTLFGMKPEDVASTVAAHEAKLGEMDLAKINVVQV
jgi:uncharacterized protein (DUF362 family)